MRAVVGAALAAIVLALSASPAVAQVSTQGQDAGNFLLRELTVNGAHFPAASGDVAGDAGLTADAVIGLEATDQGAAQRKAAVQWLRTKPVSTPGLAGKFSIVATTEGVDPRSWAQDTDLIATIESNQNKSTGNFVEGETAANVFSQSLAILGLHRYAVAHPEGKVSSVELNNAVTWLLRQQCPGGGFRLTGDGANNCGSDSGVSADSTGMAVWALSEVDGHRDSIAKAVQWLQGEQGADGGFGAGSGATANSNSTGLGALALRLGGANEAADKAATWISGVQVDNEFSIEPMRGAILLGTRDKKVLAANPGAYWYKDKEQQIPFPQKRDVLRRATAQAILGLAVPKVTPPPPPPNTPVVPVKPPAPVWKPQQAQQKPVTRTAAPVRRIPVAAHRTVAPVAPTAEDPLSTVDIDPVSSDVTKKPGAGFGPPARTAAGPPAQPPVAPGPPVDTAGSAQAAPTSDGFADFMRSPLGIGTTTGTGLLLAVATFFLVTRFGRGNETPS